MSKPKPTMAILFAVVITIGIVASTGSIVLSALAARGGGQSNNGCGLTGESGAATSDGRELGASTSQNAHNLKDLGSSEGEQVSAGASGCRH